MEIYICKNCGHKSNKCLIDKFIELVGASRSTSGNALCEKCNHPIPRIAVKDKSC
jgi:hypothetical protein